MTPPAANLVELTPRRRDRLSVALLSDTHYWPDGGEGTGSGGSVQVLDAGEEILATLAAEIDVAQPDAVIHLGDVTCGGGSYAMTAETFGAGLQRVTQMLRARSAPAFALPGNHDCLPGGSDWSLFEALWALEPGQGYTLDTPFARLVLLNAQGHSAAQIAAAKPGDPVYGWVNEAELARLDQALAGAGTRPVIVLMHQVLRRWQGPQEWKEFYGVRNADAVLDALARYGNVRVVIQGHAHRLDVQSARLGDADTMFVIVPSLIEYPLAWMRLDFDAQSLRMQLCSLPLPALLERTAHSGDGQIWRSGEHAWQDMTIPL